MNEIMNSLGKVSARLSEEAFLTNKGLSNEVGIHVFCYAPEHEMTVRAYFENLKSKTDVPYRLIERDLYKIFLEICEEKRVLKSIPSMEERKGKEYLSEQLQKIATPEPEGFVSSWHRGLFALQHLPGHLPDDRPTFPSPALQSFSGMSLRWRRSFFRSGIETCYLL